MIRLQDIDLNLLVVFQLMYRERKTSTVAEILGLTQPAVSNAIARLRKVLGDDLFLRTARGMEPTPFADSIAEPVLYALSTLENSVNVRDAFDPATSTRTFRVAMTDIGEIYFLPRLMARLARIAPGIGLSTVRNASVNLKQEMETGGIDLAIGLLPQLLGGFFQRSLFTQPYVCLMRRNHPLLAGGKTFDRAAFEAAEHGLVVSEGTGHGQLEVALKKSGIDRIVRLGLPHFVAVPYIMRTTDLVFSVPEKLAESVTDLFDLVAFPHPVPLPDISINLFWHRRYHLDAGNQWLRGLLFEMFSE